MKLSPRVRPFLVLGLSVLTLVGTADAAEGLEQRRIAQNSQNLQKIYPPMRAKIAANLKDLEANGYWPVIDNAVYRTPAQQADLKRKGYSKVSYSYHNVTGAKGQPEALAADIVDIRWGWTGQAPRAYWLKLANSARVHSLYSGAHFGLSAANKSKLDAALVSRNFAYSGPLGWDPAHVEVKGVSLAQAKKGMRPKY